MKWLNHLLWSLVVSRLRVLGPSNCTRTSSSCASCPCLRSLTSKLEVLKDVLRDALRRRFPGRGHLHQVPLDRFSELLALDIARRGTAAADSWGAGVRSRSRLDQAMKIRYISD